MRLLALLPLCSLNACSLLFVQGPPARATAYTTLTCTTSRAAPAIDVILAGVEAVGTTVYVSNRDRGEADVSYIAGGLVGAALFGISAAYGFTAVNNCGEAIAKRDELAEEHARRDMRERDSEPR